MSTLSLSSIKENYGITDDLPIKYGKKEHELILHIPLRKSYRRNEGIINQARNLNYQRNNNGWKREDFFSDFMKVRDKVLKEVKAHYGKE